MNLTLFSALLGAVKYNNFELRFPLMSLQMILWGMYAGFLAACLFGVYCKRYEGEAIRRLLEKDARDASSAMTLKELGLKPSGLRLHALRSAVARKYLRAAEIDYGGDAAGSAAQENAESASGADSDFAAADAAGASTDGDSALTNGGSALTNGGSALTNGGSALTNGGSASTSGGSALTNGGSALTNGGSALTSGDSASTNGDSILAEGDSASTNVEAGKKHGRRKERNKAENYEILLPAKLPDNLRDAHLYIPENLRDKAYFRYEKKGTGMGVFFAAAVILLAVAVLLSVFIPELVTMLDNLITYIKKG